MKTPITCWNCDSEYDYQQHEVCPMCDVHFLDAPDHTSLEPSPGTRVSVKIDYSRQRLKALPALMITLCLLFSACTHYSCPTYSDTEPIQRIPPELIPVDSVEKDKFSLAEKTGAVLFGLFVIYAIENNRDVP